MGRNIAAATKIGGKNMSSAFRFTTKYSCSS